MKKITAILLFCIGFVLCTQIQAQDSSVIWGVKGGLNISKTNFEGDKVKTGFNMGFTVDAFLNPDWMIFSGIELTNKGMRNVMNSGDYHMELKINMMYVQVPAKLGYRIKTKPGLDLHIAAEPYFAYGIGGKVTDYENGEKMNEFPTSEIQKNIDYGVGVETGVTFSATFQIRAGYDYGLADIAKDKGNASRNTKAHNSNFYISMGVLIY